MNANMNDRQVKILIAVIEEYTKTGLPVGSSVLVDKYRFNVSAATLRNDMVKLEEEDLLHQPHTSAGRIPTDRGYRYFVEDIMPERELSKKEQQSMQRELLQLRAQNSRLTRTTAKLLST
jgi:heat-inducible transcriptional repressor